MEARGNGRCRGRHDGDGRARPVHLSVASERAIFVAAYHGAIAGHIVVLGVPFAILDGTDGDISDLIVVRQQRGAGTGRRLIAAAEDCARELGCVRLMLNNRVAAESVKRAFYPKLGFRHRDGFATS